MAVLSPANLISLLAADLSAADLDKPSIAGAAALPIAPTKSPPGCAKRFAPNLASSKYLCLDISSSDSPIASENISI